jgi:nucleoside-diphosphate-sugar epimerase
MTDARSDQLVIIGCGDIGRRIAQLALAAGRPVTALTRAAQGADQLKGLGIHPVVGDLDQGDRPLGGLPTSAATLIYLAPPPGGGDIDPRVRVLCGSIEPGTEPRTLVYISTSAVYGDCQGAWVNEDSPAVPASAHGRRRLDAEQLLRAWGTHRGVRVVTLRVPGIYGPGRFPFDRLQGGHPVLLESESAWTNLIHADDLANLALAAAENGRHGEIFNVGDGEPLTLTAYFNALADAFDLPRPPQIPRAAASAVMTPLMLAYFSESRRLDVTRIRSRLSVPLLHPNLAHGLAAAKAAGVSPLFPRGREAAPSFPLQGVL